MGFTGAITITPPLTRAEMEAFDRFRTVDPIPAAGGGAGTLVPRKGVDPHQPHWIWENLRDVVNHFPDHEFAGFIEFRSASPSLPPVSRYVVSEGRVETITPTLTWPGESPTLEQLAVEQGVGPYDPASHTAAGLTDEEAVAFNAALADCEDVRDLARALWSALREATEDYGDIARIDPGLDVDERLPYWLTGVNGAPETWRRRTDDEAAL
jgi:hypothetical protein